MTNALLTLILALAAAQSADLLPGMPPPLDPRDVYAAGRPGNMSPAVKGFPDRIYVPNSGSNTVDVIDPHTFKIINHFDVGKQPQHVVPSWDLKTLWVLNDLGDSLTKIDPTTGNKGETVPVIDPYNMYYTPDGKYAIVVAEAKRRLDFRDPQTMKLVESVPVNCRGVDHMDFSVNGRYLVASCEFSAELIKVDVPTRKVVGRLKLQGKTKDAPMPQDTRLAPDGSVFFVADMMSNGVFIDRWRDHEGRRIHSDRQGHSRPLFQPRLEAPLRLEPRRGIRLGGRRGDAEGLDEVADSRRRQSRHGRRVRGRQSALAVGPL